MSYSSASGDFDIAVGGDCMLTRRLSIYDEPQFLALRKYFTDCDAGFVNLESVVRHWNEGTPGITRGTFMTTPPELLADLKWFGVNIVSCANNHAFDYGEGGLVATMQHLDRHGIARAGSGHNLAEARMPGYLETRGGRVALLATTSTYRDWNRAGAQRPDLRGRPGVNPFSSSTKTVLDAEAFDAMKRMSRELGFEQARARDRTHFYSEKESPPDRAEELLIFGQHFVKGDHFTMSSAGDPDDIADHLRWIREARRQADWVVMSFHTHDFAHGSFAKAKTKIDLKLLSDLRLNVTRWLMTVEFSFEEPPPPATPSTFEVHLDPLTGENEVQGFRPGGLLADQRKALPLSALPEGWQSTGRNQPCPCGSGNKFKHCHGTLI